VQGGRHGGGASCDVGGWGSVVWYLSPAGGKAPGELFAF
jgi:hypothetical protein